MKYPQCQWCIEHVASVNVWGNAGMAALKAIAGIFGNSWALIADSIHSLTDVVMAVLLHVSLKIGARPADKTYPYGYGHIEFIAAGFIGISLIFVSIIIWYKAITSIISGVSTEPGAIAVMALIISIVGNELLFRHSLCVGKQAQSPAVIANAWENHGDTLTSFAALVGVTGAKLGFPILDPLAAIGVAGMVAYVGGKILSGSVKDMMDGSVDQGQIDKIHNIAAKVKGIREITSLATRKSGQKIWIDMEVAVDSQTDLRKAHNIKEKIKEAITEKIDNIGNITVYLRPCRA